MNRTLYDRELGRILHFDSLDSVPGVVDARMYGCPIPYYPFVGQPQNKHAAVAVHKTSRWVYASQKAPKGCVGMEAPMPKAEELIKHTTIPKPISFGGDDDNESDDGLTSLPPIRMELPPSPALSVDMAPIGNIPDIEVKTSTMSIFTNPLPPRQMSPANTRDVCQGMTH